MIFVIIGKSATGKDTIYNEMMKKYPEVLNRIIPYTTRPRRKGEIDGVQYNFTTREEFEELDKKNLVIESRTYDTQKGLWTYYTVNENIDPNLTYLIIGTIESFNSISNYFKGTIDVIPIYIWLEDHDRLMRAIKREEEQDNPDYLELCRRYLADAEDFSEDKIESIRNKSLFFINYKNEYSVERSAEFIMNLMNLSYAEVIYREALDSEAVSL